MVKSPAYFAFSSPPLIITSPGGGSLDRPGKRCTQRAHKNRRYVITRFPPTDRLLAQPTRAPAVPFFPPIRAGNYHFLNDTERHCRKWYRDDLPLNVRYFENGDGRFMRDTMGLCPMILSVVRTGYNTEEQIVEWQMGKDIGVLSSIRVTFRFELKHLFRSEESFNLQHFLIIEPD